MSAEWSVLRHGGLIACAGLLTFSAQGCVAPLVKPEGPTLQYKVDHVVDWHALAARSVAEMRAASAPVHVAFAEPDTPFARVYAPALEAALIDAGYAVAAQPEGARRLEVGVEAFLYGSPDGNGNGLHGKTTLGTAVFGATKLAHITSDATALLAGAVVAPTIDLLYALGDTTRAEVSVVHRIADGQAVTDVSAQAFYVRPTDLTFYLPIESPALPLAALPVVEVR